jgi:peptidoglycan/xylan/chitin deacetylase (PgdA/CDA1 family)
MQHALQAPQRARGDDRPMPGPRWLTGLLLACAVAGCGAAAARRRSTAPRPVARSQHAGFSALHVARHFAARGLPVYCGARRGHLVALTFDDGPGPYSHYVLHELRRAHDRATFFLVGRSIGFYPKGARSDRALGAIGDHTMTHPNLTLLAPAAAAAEIAHGRAAAERSSGTVVWLFRPPYGARSLSIDREIHRQGMVEILWDVDSTDSRIAPPSDFRTIAATVLRHVRPGSIVLMHDNRGQTVRALRTILPALHRRGLQAVTLPQLLAQDPPSAAQVRHGWAGCGARASAGATG